MNYEDKSEIKKPEEINPQNSLTCIDSLNKESIELINKIISEADLDKAKDLTYLFNINQNKKTLARVNKLSDLMDTMTQQALVRFTTKPDEISNKELMDGLKIIQDLIERGQRQAAGVDMAPAPLIQINQQTNSVNVDGSSVENNLGRESRERVKNVVLNLLKEINSNTIQSINENSDKIVDIDYVDIIEEVEETNND